MLRIKLEENGTDRTRETFAVCELLFSRLWEFSRTGFIFTVGHPRVWHPYRANFLFTFDFHGRHLTPYDPTAAISCCGGLYGLELRALSACRALVLFHRAYNIYLGLSLTAGFKASGGREGRCGKKKRAMKSLRKIIE